MGLRTKELVIPAELMQPEFGSNNRVVITRISAPMRWRITDEAAPTRANAGGIKDVSVSKEIIQISTCVKAVVSAPWSLNDPSVYKDIDWELQDWLLDEINDFNSPLLKKKENLSSISSEGGTTTLSQ